MDYYRSWKVEVKPAAEQVGFHAETHIMDHTAALTFHLFSLPGLPVQMCAQRHGQDPVIGAQEMAFKITEAYILAQNSKGIPFGPKDYDVPADFIDRLNFAN